MAHPWRRRAVLALLAQAWVVQGLAILAGAWSPIALPDLVHVTPPPVLAALWIGPGLVGLVTAAGRTCEHIGLGAVVAVPVAMAVSWVLGGLAGVTGQSLASGLTAGWTWATVATLIMIVAGWAEAPRHSPGGEGE